MPIEDIPQQNTGVIVGQRPEDWIGGTIPFEERNPSGDWRAHLPHEEKQYSDNTDTMGCVSFSMNNALEIQNKFYGIDVNYSDRFLAKISGTTSQGNYLYKVADAVRNTGLVLEADYPAPPNYNWATYYSVIPQDVLSKAEGIPMNYEWLSPDKGTLQVHLKHAPIQIVIPEPYPNHAVVLVAIEGDTAFYFDTYPPYLKSISLSKINSALKPVLMNEFVKTINIQGTVGVVLLADTVENYKFLCKMHKVDPKVQPDGSIQTDLTI